MTAMQGIVKTEKEHTEEPADAYAEYISRRREANQEEKIATLRLPTPQMEALGYLLNMALDKREDKTPLTQEEITFWNKVTRGINDALRNAE